MSFVTTQTGQLLFLQAIVNSEILLLKLYSNNRIPSKTDVIGNYTQVSSSGYAPKLLTPSEWEFDIDELTDDYVASFAEQTFTFDDSVQVYGYYITNNDGSKLILAERFPTAPVTVGGDIKITPTLKAN